VAAQYRKTYSSDGLDYNLNAILSISIFILYNMILVLAMAATTMETAELGA